jgi:hypothetical protein
MIQFNLLPDVKLQYLKTQRTKRMVVVSSVAAATISLAILTVLFLSVQVAQKKHLDDLSANIKTEQSKLNAVPDLNKILTIQNQLKSLPDLHTAKPVTSRLFGYIQQVTPVQATISSMSIDFVASTMSISGTTDSLVTANKFADTLKFATYSTDPKDTTVNHPFKNIVTTLSRGDKNSTYSFTLVYDPILFKSEVTPVITVPKIISTRSETEKPEAIFKEAPVDKTTTKAGTN